MDISFIILTWNSQDHIKRCIVSYSKVLDNEGLTGEFFIVDNGSTDHTRDVIRNGIIPQYSIKHKINVIELDNNHGTTISRNMALRKATGSYIIICDSDTEYFQGRLSDSLEYLNNNPDVGIVAPMLLWPDGTPQPSARKFPTLLAKSIKVLNIVFNLPVTDYDFYRGFPWNEPRPVETAASACWIFRKELLDRVGYLDEKIFYSPEDLDYCYRLWSLGLKVVFYPLIKIYHHAQWISRKKPFSRHALSHFLGLLYYFKKHGYIFRPYY